MNKDEELKTELDNHENLNVKKNDENNKKKKNEKKEDENEMIKIPDWDLEPPFDTVDRGEL